MASVQNRCISRRQKVGRGRWHCIATLHAGMHLVASTRLTRWTSTNEILFAFSYSILFELNVFRWKSTFHAICVFVKVVRNTSIWSSSLPPYTYVFTYATGNNTTRPTEAIVRFYYFDASNFERFLRLRATKEERFSWRIEASKRTIASWPRVYLYKV